MAEREKYEEVEYVKTDHSNSYKMGTVSTIGRGKFEPTKWIESSSNVVFDEKSKTWSSMMNGPPELVRFVVRMKAAMKRKIEGETGCRLIFPGKGKKGNKTVQLLSEKPEHIEQCRDRIVFAVKEVHERSPFTHFVSIRMSHDEIRQNFHSFMEAVRSDPSVHETCKNKSLFQAPEKLHLTIVMLKLLSDEEKQIASAALQQVVNDCAKKIVKGQRLELYVKGLRCMNDNPGSTNVVYAVVTCESLNEISNAIANAMRETGFAPHRADSVKIHLTLMNTCYALQRGRRIGKMDATALIRNYGDYYFGRVVLEEFHLSSRFDAKDESGYYTSVIQTMLV